LEALETQEFRTTPIPFWLVSFSDLVKGAMHQLFFVDRFAQRDRS
jgi:hypothetical protein